MNLEFILYLNPSSHLTFSFMPDLTLLLNEFYYLFNFDYIFGSSSVRRQSLGQISDFISKHYGNDVFIIGNGPSLNKTPLNLIPNRDNYCFLASNGFFLYSQTHGINADLLAVEDPFPAEDMKNDIRNYPSLVISPFDLIHILGTASDICYINFRRRSALLGLLGTRFSYKFPYTTFWGGTVTFLLLQIAYALKPRNIYLVGCDLNYQIREGEKLSQNVYTTTQDDINHFSPIYFKNKRWHDPKIPQMHKAFECAYRHLSDQGISVTNLSPGSKITSIPTKDFREFLNYE